MPTASKRSPVAGAAGRWAPDPGPTTGAVPAPAVPVRRSPRRPGFLLAGVTVVAIGALAGQWQLSRASYRTPVVVVARAVQAGDVVQQADLRVAQVALEQGVAAVPASGGSALVGKVARVDLVVGSVVAPGQVGDAAGPPAGQVLVVLGLPASRMPASGLHPGDHVLVVSTPATEADGQGGAPVTIPGTVVRVGSQDSSGVAAVDVHAAAGDGPALAARAASGRVAVVVEPPGQG